MEQINRGKHVGKPQDEQHRCVHNAHAGGQLREMQVMAMQWRITHDLSVYWVG
jgi:hypothetical protein